MKAGLAKTEMTYFEPNIGMFGFGRYEHRAIDIETPLYSRALVIEDNSHNLTAIVVAEIGFPSHNLKMEVLKILEEKGINEWNESNFLLSANHTHSAAGGYFHYPLYNFPTSGFHRGVLDRYANSIAESIIEASNKKQDVLLSIHKGIFDPETPVCFNRSFDAYNANEDVEKMAKGEERLGTDREMILLKICDLNSQVIGCINWFGVHTTSVGNDHHKICSDNKGYAATFHENKHPYLISIFAQKPCGDITPLKKEERIDNRATKMNENDYIRAARNGKLQFEKAEEIMNSSPSLNIEGLIDAVISYKDFTKIKKANSGEYLTSDASMGIAFFRGAVDGRGISELEKKVVSGIINWVKHFEMLKIKFTTNKDEISRIKNKYLYHSPKKILVETTQRRILGSSRLDLLPVNLDKILKQLKRQFKTGALENHPLTPSIIPLQIIKIGTLAIVALPSEPTVTCGKRIKQNMQGILSKAGINEVIIMPYSNEFSGYVTTPEEYNVQMYEGGHTLYGKNTLAAYLQELRVLAEELIKEPSGRNIQSDVPLQFTEEILNKRLYNHKLS